MQQSQEIATNPLMIFDEDDNKRRRGLLNIFLAGIALLAIVILILAIVFRGQDEQGALFIFWSTPPLLLVCGFIYYINKYNIQAGSIIFLLLLVSGTVFSDVPHEVLEGRSLFFMIAPVMIASFIISPIASFYTAVAASLALFGVAASAQLPMNFVGAVGFFLFAFVSWLAASAYENTLIALKAINKELDQRVYQRTAELAEALERLKGLDKMKTKFVSDVSHELRTPISNISMYLEMFEHGDPAKTGQYLEVVKEDTKRLIKLVEDTLNLSRLEAGEVKKEFKSVDLNEICNNVIIANKLRAVAKGLDLSFTPDMDLPRVWVISDQIIQVAANLVSNAINYTPKGGVSIATFYDKDNNQIGFYVQDTGLGIIPEDREHLFERFYRGDRASQSAVPGTGLGLAICQEIIKEHNGSIEVDSKDRMGSKFTVYLPLERRSVDRELEPTTLPEQSSSSPNVKDISDD